MQWSQSILIFQLFPLLTLAFALRAEELPQAPATALRRLFSEPMKLFLVKTAAPPMMDGRSDDDCWRGAKGVRIPLKDRKGVARFVDLKTCEFSGTAYFLLTYPVDEKNPKDIRWRWDPVKHAYFIAAGTEPALLIVFTDESADFADVWIWRAARNDPAGFADDLSTSEDADNSLKFLRMDAGKPAWFSRYFAEFAGAELPRFYSRAPSGSTGDVKGRSSFKDENVTVELARKIKTGHRDDLDLDSSISLRVILIRNNY